MASKQFEDLFTKHGAASFDKQIYLDAMLGKRGWAFDLNSGVLAFRRPHEENLQLNAQVLGTESADSQTWLWGWANPSGIPDALLKSANELKAFGAAAGAPELITPELPITPEVNPQRIAMIGCGVQRAGCFFRAPYPRGALYLLIKDPRYKRSVTRPIPRILRVFPMFLSDYHVANQRAALLSYLQFYRLDVRDEGRHIVAATKATPRTLLGAEAPQQLVAEFDERDRLIALR
ncbi:MAG: hypothetical protein RMN52_08445 [Anaerolineae bacterium]|nr:hypothetical protein [Candidatus Roseilinea sp.]MDW8450019.1 hypothetical protein [Anaerolineae bacterium]